LCWRLTADDVGSNGDVLNLAGIPAVHEPSSTVKIAAYSHMINANKVNDIIDMIDKIRYCGREYSRQVWTHKTHLINLDHIYRFEKAESKDHKSMATNITTD